LLVLGFLIPGTCKIEARAAGYETSVLDRQVAIGENSSLEITLKPLPLTKAVQEAGLTFEPGYSYLRIKLDSQSALLPTEGMIFIENGTVSLHLRDWSWTKIKAGEHTVRYNVYQFNLDVADGHLYDAVIHPKNDMLTSAANLPGWKDYPLEPEWLPETYTVETYKLHPETTFAVFASALGPTLNGFGWPLAIYLSSQHDDIPMGFPRFPVFSIIGGIFGSSAGILVLDTEKTSDLALWNSVGSMLGLLAGLITDGIAGNTAGAQMIKNGGWYFAFGSMLAGMVPGLLWGIRHGTKGETTVESKSNEMRNAEEKARWERDKMSMDRYNQQILDSANDQIRRENVNRGFVEIRDSESDKVQTIPLT
jgi:hypothetical protein